MKCCVSLFCFVQMCGAFGLSLALCPWNTHTPEGLLPYGPISLFCNLRQLDPPWTQNLLGILLLPWWNNFFVTDLEMFFAL